jgi:inhibitor of KinA
MKKYQPYGDDALLVTFGDQVSEAVHLEIQIFLKALEKKKIAGMLESFSAYTSVTIQYDFFKVSYGELVRQLEELEEEKMLLETPNIVKIPVCYHVGFSWDMEEVIRQTKLTKKEIIDLHTAPTYLVYMLGFTPGFFYLGGMHEKLKCNRRKSPRLRMEEGAVGIAGVQTGVYSVPSPGGWQVIGKTPVSIFDKKNQKAPFLVKRGDRVQFYEISIEEYKNMRSW